MRNWGVRALFAVAVLLLPVQVWVKNNISEPYPALFAPAFAAVPQEGTLAVSEEPRVVVGYEDGTEETVPFAQVLPAGGPSARLIPFRSAFRDDTRAHDPRTVAFVADRLAERGGRPVSSMTVHWEEVVYDLSTGERWVRAERSRVELDLQVEP